METKHCNQCATDKPASDFHKRSASNDGLAALCKSCQREYDRARAHSPHRIKAREPKLTSIGLYCVVPKGHPSRTSFSVQGAHYQRNKGIYNKRSKVYRQNNPKKRAAHTSISNALRDGKLTKDVLCQYCGAFSSLHAHHADYDRPLCIQWLCVPCHKAWHVENGEGANA